MEMLKVKEIASVTSGNSAPQDKALFEGGTFPFVRTGDVGRVHRCTCLTHPEDYLNEKGIKGLRLFPKGSILIPKSGASTLLNHRAILGEDSYVVSHLAVLIPDESRINPLYLYYLTTHLDVGDLVDDRSYPSLKTSTLENITIPVPTLLEQVRIAAELDLLSGIIDKQKTLLIELDTLAQSIFYDMFGDPVANEKGWAIKSIAEVCASKKDIRRAVKLYSKDDSILYIDISSIDNIRNVITYPTEYVFRESPSRAQQAVVKNDVLISLVRPNLNNVALVGFDDKNLVASSGFCVLRATDAIKTPFLFFIVKMKHFTDYLTQRVSGANYPAVREDDIMGYPIIVPPTTLQQSFAEKIEAIEKQKASINESIVQTQKLFDYTMGKYFG